MSKDIKQNISTPSQSTVVISKQSVDIILGSFTKIDERIISLLKCSSEDFSQLNSHFKKCHKEAKVIAENANIVFSSITNNDNSFNFINEINNNTLQIINFKQAFIESLKNFDRSIEKIYRSLEMMFVPSNNFNQNVMTLKLLIAKLKIDLSSMSEHDKKQLNINAEIEIIKLSLQKFNNQTNTLKEHIQTSSQETTQLIDVYDKDLSSFINRLKESQDILSDKYKEAGRVSPDLLKETKLFSERAAKIITNLQYDDILRQKIEHVQKVHKIVLSELSLNDSEDINKIDYLLKVKDIANLQASQLILANKEYQSAIEVISNNLLEFVDTMANISSICDTFSNHSKESHSTHFEVVRFNLETGNELKLNLQNTSDQLTGIIHNLVQYYTNSRHDFKQIEESVVKIISAIHQIQAQAKKNSNELYDMIGQYIDPLLNDIKRNRERINDLFHIIDKMIGDIKAETELINLKIKQTENLFSQNNKVISSISINNKALFNLLDENNKLSKTLFFEVKKSVEEVKYYGFFEKTIEEIITFFEDINKILYDLDESKADKQKNLNEIKSHYTMKSEHLVHDIVTSHENNDIDFFEVEETKEKDKEEDNLELF